MVASNDFHCTYQFTVQTKYGNLHFPRSHIAKPTLIKTTWPLHLEHKSHPEIPLYIILRFPLIFSCLFSPLCCFHVSLFLGLLGTHIPLFWWRTSSSNFLRTVCGNKHFRFCMLEIVVIFIFHLTNTSIGYRIFGENNFHYFERFAPLFSNYWDCC